MTKDEALKLALEALEMWCPMTATYLNTRDEAITAIREALAQPEQEPVACPDGKPCKHGAWCTETYCQEHCEFRAPPQRKPLSDEVIWLEYQRFWPFHPAEEPTLAKDIVKFARAIEAAHGITGESK